MNKYIWSGVIAWGILVICFGLGAMNPTDVNDAAPLEEVIFLLAGGIVTSLIGIVGLIAFMGWLPMLKTQGPSQRHYYRLNR